MVRVEIAHMFTLYVHALISRHGGSCIAVAAIANRTFLSGSGW